METRAGRVLLSLGEEHLLFYAIFPAQRGLQGATGRQRHRGRQRDYDVREIRAEEARGRSGLGSLQMCRADRGSACSTVVTLLT